MEKIGENFIQRMGALVTVIALISGIALILYDNLVIGISIAVVGGVSGNVVGSW